MKPHQRQPPQQTPPRPAPAPVAAAAAAAASPPALKPPRTAPSRPSRSPPKPDRPAPARPGRKPRPAAGADKENDGGELRHHRRPLVMEEVKILKRGEEMKPSSPALRGSNGGVEPPVSSTGRIGPDAKRLWFPAADSVYAGPGFSATSPEPSSVPYPGYLLGSLAASKDATRSLLHLLRLKDIAP